MLETLSIKNFAIIEDIEISFKDGMNVLLGETGAGKSIIIEALSLLKGERSSFDKIRAGAQKAFIDGRFIIKNSELIKEINDKYDDLIEEDELIVTRTLDIAGKSSIKLNGRMFTASIAKAIMSEILDIHSQHENLQLFEEKYHINLLDKFIADDSLLTEYRSSYSHYLKEQQVLKELENKVIDEDELAYKKSLIEEIKNLNLEVGELDKLENLKKKMANYVRIQEVVDNVANLLDSDDGAISRIYQSKRLLDSLKDDDFETLSDKLNETYYQTQEVLEQLKSDLNSLNEYEYSPDYIADRIYQIKRVMRKFGNEEKDIFDALERLNNDINLMSDYEYALNKQKEVVENSLNDVKLKGEKLSALRLEYAQRLALQVDKELSDLALVNAHFKVKFTKVSPLENGIDNVAFHISSNLGMPFGPLKDVISGGESSRIMLGLKSIFTEFSNLETIIFDEIDTGVSGRIASSVGKKIAQIGKDRQVIVITHLPQVAAFASHSYEVKKLEENATTKTHIIELDEQGFLLNIAKLLSDGIEISKSIPLAQELIDNSRK